jgi:N-succinyldiaminopimelate aminotransferase
VPPLNPRLAALPTYPFERLKALLKGVTPPPGLQPISMGMGEPRHAPPKVFLEAVAAEAAAFGRYPTTGGEPALRRAAAGWLARRFGLETVDPDTQVIPCAGTREALFSIAQAVVGRPGKDLVLLPNPFYQIYEGAALWAGATPRYVPALPERGFLPDYAGLPAEVLDRTALLYLCSPGNPSGAVAPVEELGRLIELAERHDFVVVSDECYSEIYPDEARPPAGLLEAAAHSGRDDYARCLAFHSLSKRSSLAGARSGFVAGDGEVLAEYLRLRTYTGCATPLPIQRGAAAAWNDETHVVANRVAYRDKLAAVLPVLSGVLPVAAPQAGFYLWIEVPGGGEAFARRLYAECAVTVLPGAYLSREADGACPGEPYVRMALVDDVATCVEAAERVRHLLERG